MTSYRIRRSVAVASSSTVPLLGGLVLALVLGSVTDPAWTGVFVGTAFAVVMGTLNVRRVRRRSLTVLEDALVVQRDHYRLHVPWQSITAVQRRRHQWFMNVEELVCSGGQVEAIDSHGRASTLPKGLEQHPAVTRVMVSLYAKDWRSGPIGDRMRQLGIET